MGLREKLKAKQCVDRAVTINDDALLIRGLTHRTKGELHAKCKDKKTGQLDNSRLEAELLAVCVIDPETGQAAMSSAEWAEMPAKVTGPILGEVLKDNGYEEAELGNDGQDSTAET